MNTLVENIPKNEITAKYENLQIEPNVIPVKNPNNQNETFWIYDNFEIIKEDTIKIFIDKHKIGNHFECNFCEGKAIIHYGKTIGNKKYISVIGSLDNDNTFINEYLCIYDSHSSNEKHMNKIIGNLLNYLNNLKLYMNTSPITDSKYKEIGLIIKLGKSPTEPTDDNQNYYVDEKEYNLVKRRGSIRTQFALPPLIGFDNIGATCYMNATLQCFCHIEKFVNFFKYPGDQLYELVKKDKKKLSSSFK